MFKKSIATLAVIASIAAAGTLALSSNQAEAAGGRNAAFAVGAITGLAVGAMAANAHYGPVHYAPRRPAPHYYGRPAPWTPAWYRYCSARYRSFDPHTGYFVTYSGHHRFCR
ncbi:BA14K family protein [uncultured Cohaesibacter sp.]|uniref:BA14K family protein n=1 Tax=uncultured Cohaesibacter sp. TaxID=1002546 RepID=UPI0029C7926C|nr:BA14K family protein [uncultured Cohaesibacter sp.]